MTHIINKHVCEIKTSSSRLYKQINDVICVTMQQSVYTKLAAICDKHCTDEVERINRIEIDLGQVNLSNLRSMLIDELPEKFEAALRGVSLGASNIRSSNKASNNNTLPSAADELEALLYFLNTGTLPWWASYKARRNISEILPAAVAGAPRRLRSLLAGLGKAARVRLIMQHGDEQLTTVTSALLPRSLRQEFADIQDDLYVLLSVLAVKRCLCVDRLRRHYRLFLLDFVLQEHGQVTLVYLINKLIEYMSYAFYKISAGDLRYFIRNLIRDLSRTYKYDKPESKLLSELQDKDEPKELTAPLRNIYRQIKAGSADKAERIPAERMLPEVRPVAFTDSDLSVYIENSGLILYWSYLKTLFAGLGFLNKSRKNFINNAARTRAIFLLQNIAQDKIEAAENELTLNKILCGMPFDRPIPRFVNPSSRQIEEGSRLTDSLIANWPALGKITPIGFKSSFVMRSGVLKQGSNQWTLHIEKKPRDILLSKLPWSIHVIKTDWMPVPVIVEW